MLVPTLPANLEEEEGGDDDNAASSSSSQLPTTQLPSTSQASRSQPPCDRRPGAPSSGSGKRVDEAILKLADCLSQNTGMQDRQATAVQESTNPRLAFCQWMGLEMSQLDELWTGFIHEWFNLVECHRNLQAHQPVPSPPPQPAQLPAVQPRQQQLPFVHPLSVPLLASPPTFRQQFNQPWQPSTDFQPQGWPTLRPNLSGLNTSGLSGFLDLAGQTSGPGTSSVLSTPEAPRPGSTGSNTSEVLRAAYQTMDQE